MCGLALHQHATMTNANAFPPSVPLAVLHRAISLCNLCVSIHACLHVRVSELTLYGTRVSDLLCVERAYQT
jgi:hypothetical protein